MTADPLAADRTVTAADVRRDELDALTAETRWPTREDTHPERSAVVGLLRPRRLEVRRGQVATPEVVAPPWTAAAVAAVSRAAGVSRAELLEAVLVDAGAVQVVRGHGDVVKLLEHVGLAASDRDVVVERIDRRPGAECAEQRGR